jgi:hypothetical protein
MDRAVCDSIEETESLPPYSASYDESTPPYDEATPPVYCESVPCGPDPNVAPLDERSLHSTQATFVVPVIIRYGAQACFVFPSSDTRVCQTTCKTKRPMGISRTATLDELHAALRRELGKRQKSTRLPNPFKLVRYLQGVRYCQQKLWPLTNLPYG